MKTLITGVEPNTTIPAEIAIESVYATPYLSGEAAIDLRVGDKVVRVSLRELAAAVHGAEKAVPPPGGWSLQGIHWNQNGTVVTPPQWPPIQGY